MGRWLKDVSAHPLVPPALLVAGALAAWIAIAARMDGMESGPGADLGGFVAFLGIWVTMTTAMMLPAVLPMALLYARIARQRRGSTVLFLASYLLVWSAIGAGAYLAARAIRALDPGWLAWDAAGPWVAGGAVVFAGIYELTPLKTVCLRRCRSPLHLVMGGWRDGNRGALRLGVEHGGWCAGCCVGLMLALFTLGVMSLLWMGVVAAAIFAEKVLPGGERTVRLVAAALVALGIWVALAPASVPGLVRPDRPPMRMS